MTSINDLIIVGSGPAGYTAALYAARAQLEPLMFEGAVTAGGALMNTTDVENFPGFPEGIMGPELMMQMKAQAEKFGAKLIADDVTSMDLDGDIKVVVSGDGTEHRSRAVILAMGSGYRELGIPGEKKLSGHGVSWCATCDGFFFKDQEIAVVGGGDSAVEEATFLTRFAKRVYLIHRRDELRASKIMADRAHNDPKITMVWDSAVVEAHGEDKLSGITIRNLKTDTESELAVTGLFVAIGHDHAAAIGTEALALERAAVEAGRYAPEEAIAEIEIVGPFAIAQQIAALDLDLDDDHPTLGVHSHQIGAPTVAERHFRQ